MLGRGRVKLKARGAVDHAGVGLVDLVTEIDGSLFGGIEDGAVVGKIAFDMPVTAFVGLIFGGGSEIDVGGPEPDVGGAVILNASADREIGGENDRSPGAGASGRRRVGESQQTGRAATDTGASKARRCAGPSRRVPAPEGDQPPAARDW